MTTYFGEQVICTRPEPAAVELPSQFQIGDAVEIVLGEEANHAVIFGAYVYAVRFAGNGTVKYDVAIPIPGTEFFAVANGVRGSLRPKGAQATAEELQLVPITAEGLQLVPIEEIAPALRRSAFSVIQGGKVEEVSP